MARNQPPNLNGLGGVDEWSGGVPEMLHEFSLVSLSESVEVSSSAMGELSLHPLGGQNSGRNSLVALIFGLAF